MKKWVVLIFEKIDFMETEQVCVKLYSQKPTDAEINEIAIKHADYLTHIPLPFEVDENGGEQTVILK